MTRATTSRASAAGATDGRTIGIEVHRLLGELFASGTRRPSPIELRRHIANHPLVNRPEISYRQAAKQRLLTAASIYVRLFAPGDEWTFIASEVNLGRRRADLVWEGADGVMIDEIKAGAVASRFENDSLRKQVEALGAAGATRYGARLIGVRAIVLAAPRSSYLAEPDGSFRPLEWGCQP